MSTKITYCMVHWNRISELQKAVRHHSPHVDRTIIIDGGSTDGSIEWLQSDECKRMNVEVFVHPWCDDPPGHRNKYLEYAGGGGWVLVTDSDEYIEEPAIWNIRQIVEQQERSGVSVIAFNAHDIQRSDTGSIWENKSNYWNPMLFKMAPSVRYVGHTHVTITRLPGGTHHSPFRYFHIKSTPDQWYRGARNYWTTAAPASNVHTPEWKTFKDICGKHGMKFFHDIAKSMEEGKVPQDIVDWMISNKDSDNPEIRSYFVTYLVFMHPELNTGIGNRDFEYKSDRKQIKGMRF